MKLERTQVLVPKGMQNSRLVLELMACKLVQEEVMAKDQPLLILPHNLAACGKRMALRRL